MSFLAILAALGLEQWRAFAWRARVERAFVRYARWIEGRWNGGTAQHGWFALVAALAPPVLFVEGLFLAAWIVHPAARLRRQGHRSVFHDGVPALQPRGVGDRQRLQGE